MPTAVSYPGVYIQEVSSGVHTITGVATSIAAFAGWAPRGAVDRATLVLGWQDYVNEFGGLVSGAALGYAVNQFFNNGGQQAYIVRLADATAAAASVAVTDIAYKADEDPSTVTVTAVTPDSSSPEGLVLSAANPGAWGNNYGILIQPRLDNYYRFSLSVIYVPDTSKALMDSTTGQPDTANFSVVETFQNLSLDPDDDQARYVVKVINGESNLITAVMTATPPDITFTAGVDTSSGKPTASTLPAPGGGAFLLYDPTATVGIEGEDGALLSPADPGFATALNADGSGTGGVRLLEKVDLFNLLCVPGEFDTTVIGNLQAYCAQKRAFYIVDSDPAATVASVPTYAGSIGQDHSINSALYFPWVNAPDPLDENRTKAFPPCGFVAGIYAATDASRGVWKAPAGVTAGLVGASGPAVKLTDADNGLLNPKAVNCLRNFTPYGNVVWGARTLQGNDEVGSEWKYVPVRRLALFLEESLYRGTQWAVFEPNDEPLWSQLRLNVGAFMNDLYRQGAFQGQTAKDAYFVKCDSQTTTQSDINKGIVNIQVGFAPLKPAEFVVIQIQQIAGQL